MNVLWTKGKFNKTLPCPDQASGDYIARDRCCRLCGGETSLRHFADTYTWEGTEERYDQLLYDCFGVQVFPSDCLICEWCVRQLRCTDRFKALVHAAFDRPPSSSHHSVASKTVPTSLKISKRSERNTIESKNIIALLKSKMKLEKKKKKVDKKHTLNPSVDRRKVILKCRLCAHRYPMMAPCNGGKDFVCSRCKQSVDRKGNNKLNAFVSRNPAKESHREPAKTDTRRKSRLGNLTRKSSPIKKQHGCSKTNAFKYKCAICPKSFVTTESLAEHIKSQHAKNVCPLCSKELTTMAQLEKHMQMHKARMSLNYFSAGPGRCLKIKRDVKPRAALEKRLL